MEEKRIKIVLQGYSLCCQNKAGGAQSRIRKICSLLNKTDCVESSLFSTFETDLSDADVLHIFLLNSENYSLINYAKRNKKKVVISAIASLSCGRQVDLHRTIFSKLPILTTYKMMIESAQMADCIIVETPKEYDFIKKHYKISPDRLKIIPNGVDEINYFGKEFFDVLGKECKYVLHVGRFDENKNQLNVIKAMRGSGIHVVFIGGSDGQGYYELCQKEAEGYDNIHFLGWLESDSQLLKSAYAYADTFVMPSFNETFGLVLLEAGIAGAKLVISNTLPILDHEVFRTCRTFNPASVDDIKMSVIETFNAEKEGEFKNQLRNTFSWDRVISQHIECYRSVLK